MPARIPIEIASSEMRAANLEPLGPYQGASKPWECRCLRCNSIVFPSLLSIRSGQGGCAYCAGKKVNPESAKDLMIASGYKPLVPYPGSKAKWKCLHIKCGEIVFPQYNKIQHSPNLVSCKKCSGKYVDPIDAELLMIEAGGIPQQPNPGAKTPWKCLCMKCNQVVDSLYSTVKQGGGVCLRCARKETARKRRFSQEEVVQRCLQSNLKPLVEYTNTDAPLLCECLICGNHPSPTYTAIRTGTKCRFCSEKATSSEKAERLALMVGLEPLVPFVSGMVPWECKHTKCGNTVSPIFATILRGGNGCIGCNTKISAERYKFPEDKAIAIMREAGFEPLTPYTNALTRWECICKRCGKESKPKLNSVQNGSRCIHCSDFGFRIDEPAYIYLMFHPELNSIKVGIGGSTTRNDRIEVHKHYGWILYNKIQYTKGEDALEVEQNSLEWLRNDLNLPSYLLPSQMPQGGHTETIDAGEIDLPTIWRRIQQLSNSIK